MSSINSLEIANVRAFGSKPQLMKIGSPLTLIVGHNGSGKTTIIECLKYATTGIMPPGTSNAGFLHDPNLTGDKALMAFVKVKLTTAVGVDMVFARRMNVSLSKGKLGFKTIDNSILERDGEPRNDAVTVSEMDRLVPAWLDVSPAVLRQVILCHQDDSYWPLESAMKLKEHFDLLFEAKRWADAVAQIGFAKKEQTQKLREHTQDAAHDLQNKEQGERSFKRCVELERQIEAEQMKKSELESLMEELNSQRISANQRMQEAGEIVGKLEGKRLQADSTSYSIKTLKSRLKELSETDEELEDRLSHYDERLKEDEEAHDQQKQRLIATQKRLSSTRDQIADKQGDYKSLQARHEQHTRSISQRDELVKQTATLHDIRGFNGTLNEAQIDSLLLRLKKMSREQNTALENARSEADQQLQKHQKELNNIHRRKTELETHKDSARQQIADNNRTIEALQSDLDEIKVDEGDQVTLQRHLETTAAQHTALETSIHEADRTTHMAKIDTDLLRVETEKQSFDAEMEKATRAAGDVSLLEATQNEVHDKRERIRTISTAQQQPLTAILGNGWEVATIGTRYKAAKESASASLRSTEIRRDGSKHDLGLVEYKLNACRSDLQERQARTREAESKINAVTPDGPEALTVELEALESSRDVFKGDAAGFKLMEDFAAHCEKEAQDTGVCIVCARALRNQVEKDRLKGEMKKLRGLYDLKGTTVELTEANKQLQDLKAVRGDYETWKRLTKSEIPALQREEQAIGVEREAALAKLEQNDIEVADCLSAQQDVLAIESTVTSLQTTHADIGQLETKLAAITARLQLSGMSRGLEAINDDKQRCNEQERSLRAALTRIRTEKQDADDRLNALKLKLKDLEHELSDSKHQLQHKLSISSQIAKLKTVTKDQRQKLDTFDDSLKSSARELAEAQSRIDDLHARTKESDRTMQAKAAEVNDSLSQIRQIINSIQDYVNNDGEGQLKRTEQEVLELKMSTVALEKEASEIEVQASKLKETLLNHDGVRLNISDNLQYRKDTRALQTMLADIEHLKSRDAEQEYRHFEAEAKRLQAQNEQYISRSASSTASITAFDQQLLVERQNYEEFYADAAQKYRKSKVNVVIATACIKDLAKLGEALNISIMKYHSIKMEEVNRIIDELWRKTYQGTDVDTIYIRSDADDKGGKNYNYRVCMLKQQTEMDMRGRCSAGQRVLACIIIRLALAEVFSKSCGMIALDEPTTNLDRDNIEALATSLAELINVRKGQKNFQLVVITHDEEFLKFMHPSDHVDEFWRVSRDINQESMIKRESIHTLMR